MLKFLWLTMIKAHKATKENPGLIAIKGDMVMQGYYKDEESLPNCH